MHLHRQFSEAEIVYRRDDWRCAYCGLDGSASFEAWQSLTWDHLLPTGNTDRNNHQFIVTACDPCNTMLAAYFRAPATDRALFENPDPQRLLAARRDYILPRLEERRRYWAEEVARRA